MELILKISQGEKISKEDVLAATKIQDELEALVQNTSRVRSWVQAFRWYKIGGLKDVTPVGEASEERLDKSFRDWLSLGKKAAKPKNVTRK